MNIWIFNHYAQTDEFPGGTRHFDFAKRWVAMGHCVTIFAAGFHYTLLRDTKEYGRGGIGRGTIDNVDFVWVKTFPYEKNDWRRMVNIVSYALRLFWRIPVLGLEKPDFIIGSVVHPFAPILAAHFARRYDSVFFYEIRDLWPQTFIDMRVWSASGLPARFFKWLEGISVRSSDAIVALSPQTKEYITREYGKQRMIYIPNGVDLAYFRENFERYRAFLDHPTLKRLKELNDAGKCVAMFTGALVQSNRLDLLIETAEKLRSEEMHLVIVGKGIEKKRLEAEVARRGLGNIEFLDPVEKYLVPVMLSYAAVLLLVQGKVQWGSTNKLFDYLAAGKPIVTSLYVIHNNIVEKAECGLAARAGDAVDLAGKLDTIAGMDNKTREKFGQNAIKYVEEHNDIRKLAEKLFAEMKEVKRWKRNKSN